MAELFDYIRLSKTPVNLIYKFGDSCELVTYTDTPNPNPVDPPIRTRKVSPAKGVFLRYKSEDIDGTRVRTADQRVLLAAAAANMPPEGEVEGDYEIVRNGETWKMVNVSILKPGPVTMMYTVQVRK